MTEFGIAPAAEYLATEFRQTGDEIGPTKNVIAVKPDSLGSAILTGLERIIPVAALYDNRHIV